MVQCNGCIKYFSGHTNVNSVEVKNIADFIYDEQKSLISASYDGKLRFHDFIKEDMQLGQHNNPIYSMAINRNQGILASGDKKGGLKIWDLKTQKCIKNLDIPNNRIHKLSFLENNCLKIQYLIANIDKGFKIWDINTWQCVDSIIFKRDEIMDFDISPDNYKLIFIRDSGINKRLSVYNIETFEILKSITLPKECSGMLAVSPNSQHIVVTGGSFQENNKRLLSEGNMRIYDLSTLELLNQVKIHSGHISHPVFSPDGKNIVVASTTDERIKILDLYGNCLAEISQLGSIYNLGFIEKGNFLLSIGNHDGVKIWDWASKKCIYKKRSAHNQAYAYDEEESLYYGYDGKIRISHLPSSKTLKEKIKELKKNSLTPDEKRRYYLE